MKPRLSLGAFHWRGDVWRSERDIRAELHIIPDPVGGKPFGAGSLWLAFAFRARSDYVGCVVFSEREVGRGHRCTRLHVLRAIYLRIDE